MHTGKLQGSSETWIGNKLYYVFRFKCTKCGAVKERKSKKDWNEFEKKFSDSHSFI